MATENTPTLESFSDLRAALGKTAPVEKPVTGTVETVTTPEVTPTEPAASETTHPEPQSTVAVVDAKTTEKKGPPKRFSELTRERDEAKARAAQLEAELAAARAGQTKTEPAKPAPVQEITELPGKPAKPKFEDYKDKTYEEYEAAKDKYADDMIDWKVKNLRHQEAEQAKREAAKQEWQRIDESWQAQYNRAMEEDPEFEIVVKEVAKVVAPKGLVEVVKESPVATEIVRALHADPAKLEAISKMSPASAAREIGKIEAAIQSKTTAPGTPARKLPEPPKTIGGSGENLPKEKPLGDLPMSEFREIAKKQLKPGSVGLAARRMTIR